MNKVTPVLASVTILVTAASAQTFETLSLTDSSLSDGNTYFRYVMEINKGFRFEPPNQSF